MIISRRIRRLMAYVYMPLIFIILGFLLIYIAFEPIINIGISVTSMIMAQEVPNFNLELESIYVEPKEESPYENDANIGENSDNNSGADTEGGLGNNTGNNTESNIGNNAGNNTEDNSDNNAGNDTEGNSDNNTGVDTEGSPDNNTGVDTESNLDNNTGTDTESNPENNSENNTEENSQSDTNTGSSSILDKVVWPGYGQHYAQISCNRIGLEAPIYMGDNYKILRVGAGQYLGSFPPGYGRVILIGAHCTTFFAPLQYVEIGDVFVVKTSYGIYRYKVNKIKIYKATDTNTYDKSQKKEQLVLYTCYPFSLLSGSRNQRMFVYADKISGPQLK